MQAEQADKDLGKDPAIDGSMEFVNTIEDAKLIATSSANTVKQKHKKALDALPKRIKGWFPVYFSHQIKKKDIKGFRLNDEDLIVWRDENGEVHVHSAYCQHMGANMQDAKVVKDKIVCPFHSHVFDKHGNRRAGSKTGCKQEEFLPTWHCDEKNGFIFVYYGDDTPDWRIPQLNFDGWSDIGAGTTAILEMDTHMQEMHENNVDVAHFGPVHNFQEYSNLHPYDFSTKEIFNVFRVKQVMLEKKGKPWISSVSNITFHLFGLGYAQVKVEPQAISVGGKNYDLPEWMKPKYRIFFTTRLVEGATKILFAGANKKGFITSKLPDFIGTPLHNFVSGIFFKVVSVPQLKNDQRPWEDKVYVMDPLVDNNDGPIVEYRKWCKQWYMEEGK